MSIESRRRQAEREARQGGSGKNRNRTIKCINSGEIVEQLTAHYRQMNAAVFSSIEEAFRGVDAVGVVASQHTSLGQLVFHFVPRIGLSSFMKYAHSRMGERWEVTDSRTILNTLDGQTDGVTEVSRVMWGEDGPTSGCLPTPSAVESVPLDQLLTMTAAGYELEDVAGSLFVWCPLARELLFSKHAVIADWLRKTWQSHPQLGSDWDCILIPQGGHLNLFYKDEVTVMASHPLSDELAADFVDIPFIYLRSFNRREVQICLPEER